MIVAERPTLNATINAKPNPTRWSAIALSSTTSADGHGRSPAAMPTPRMPRDVSPRGVVVVMVVVVVVVPVVMVVLSWWSWRW